MYKIEHASIFIRGRFAKGSILFDEKIREIRIDEEPASASSSIEKDGHSATFEESYVVEDSSYAMQRKRTPYGSLVIPGLIDIHTHGAIGADASDGDQSALITLSKWYASQGTTGWYPTTMTLPEDHLIKAMKSARGFIRPARGAKLYGIHLEGPFISKEKCGAQNFANVIAPDIGLLRRLDNESGGIVSLVTIAPETEGAIEFIKLASAGMWEGRTGKTGRHMTMSVGHTACDYDTAAAAFEAGASHLTHVFNAMPPLHHRQCGPIEAAYDNGAFAELICDGIHVRAPMVRIAFHLFADRLCLVSDSLRCAGMPDGNYMLGGQMITMRDGKALLTGTDTIAGSSVCLLECVRRAVSFGIRIEDAILAATLSPALSVGIEDRAGCLSVGRSADLVVLDENLSLRQVYVEGQKVL